MGAGNGSVQVRFADFEADLATGELFRHGTRVRLQRKPFQLLELLLRAGGTLVSRQEIYESVWPGVHVDQQRCLNVALGKLRTALADQARAPEVIETLGDRGYRLLVPVVFPSAAKADPPPRPGITLAVLPFQNLSGEEDDYLGYGLTEQMIAQLGRIHPEVSVIAPATVMSYQGTSKEPPEVGRELDSDYLLCGTVFRADDRFRITAKLIRAADRICLWADSYARESADIFLVQDEIAQQIAGAILYSLPVATPRDQSLTTEPAIYEQYLKAGYFFGKGHELAFTKAVELYQDVIARDPDFAPAYASLAVMLACGAHFSAQPPKIVYDQVHKLASQALVLCPDLPDPYVALGHESLFYRADFSASEKAFSRATALNSSCVLGHQGYAMLMLALGRHDQALAAMRRARDLDPLSPIANLLLCYAMYFGGRVQEALAQARVTVELEPHLPSAHMLTGWVLLVLGDLDGSIRAQRSAVDCCPQSPLSQLALAHSLACAGNQREACTHLQPILDLRRAGWASPYRIAAVYAALGDCDAAFAWLEVAIDECDSLRILLAVDPHFRALAADPRFQPLLGRLGLPEL